MAPKSRKTKGFKLRAHEAGRMVSARRPGAVVERSESVATVKRGAEGRASIRAPFDAVVAKVHVPKGKPFKAKAALLTLHHLVRAHAAGVLDWIIEEGAAIQPADTVVIISGAGQQHVYGAGVAGTVVCVKASAGDNLVLGQALVEIA